jgi:RNA polymerase sigma-70 factor (ECF subfamily)
VETRGRLDVEALYERHRLRVYRAIRGVVFDPVAAEDLTQEAFERAWRARASFRGEPEEAGSWLYRIAMNTAMSWLRRNRLARLLSVRLFSPPDPGDFEDAENRTLAQRALLALSPALRVVVVMTYYSGLTRREVADALGLPPGTVASRLAAAQKVMRQALDESPSGARRPMEDRLDA